jgi:hypothetical protein
MGLSQANVAQLAAKKVQLDALYNQLVVEVDRFSKAAHNGAIKDLRDVADGAYLCKLMSEKFEDLRKECDKAERSASQYACEQQTMLELAGLAKNGTIHAQLTTATAKVTSVVSVPKKRTPEYEAMCLDLGLTQWSLDNDLFHAHWPGIVEKCNWLLANGMRLPRGVDKHLVRFEHGLDFVETRDTGLSFRKAKDV